MSATTGPYLVNRMPDGFGEVIPLQAGQRFTLGRANTNRIVLKDELCSREHAEVFFAVGHWRLRDLESLNGTRLNGTGLEGERELLSGDEFQVGKTQFLFVKTLEELPQVPPRAAESEGVAIKKRLGQTRFLTPQPEEMAPETPLPGSGHHSLSRDLSLLYRLALDMGSAGSEDELTRTVLDGLLEAVPAEAGAILTLLEERNLEILAQRHRDPSEHEYAPLPDGVVKEVLDVKEAILAEDTARDRYLRHDEPATKAGATSLICAPVLFGGNVLNLIHLYCIDPLKSLNVEDLEFTVAVAKQLGGVIHQLRRHENLSAQNQSLREQLKVESELVGRSPAIRKIEEQIGLVAGTNATVLIRGESGSGKELVARAIHYSSPRRDAPFICLNCAALSETLLESELFGHEKGAFTGATDKKIGKFEAADSGTIFLDEIGEMAPGTQSKLLRVLEGHPYERVGGHVPIRVNVRVVAATNQPLEKNLQEGTFRRDLFFRLQVVEIRVPPLRERLSDVAMLADHFLKRFASDTGRKIRGFTASAMRKLENHVWPGNVRELRNVIERAVALGRGSSIDAGDIWLTTVEVDSDRHAESVFKPIPLDDLERRHIEKTLEHVNWNKTQAATLLKIERSTLDRKIRVYGLKKTE
ncbi:MAG: FHA domain-containing protein [Planctomycetes bacterium]|nr:FHA domain-containing protein [Planctomycetota bacterium]